MSPAPTPVCVAADVGVLRFHDGQIEILLIERRNPPYQGMWALPGGFVEPDEDLPVAAGRELAEETNVEAGFLVEIGAFGNPARDPRGRTISIVYYTALSTGKAVAGDDAASAGWFAVGQLPDMAFDHNMVVERLLARFRQDVILTHVSFAFLPQPFSLDDVSRVIKASGAAPATFTELSIAWQLKLRANIKPAGGNTFTLAAPADFLAPLGRPLLW